MRLVDYNKSKIMRLVDCMDLDVPTTSLAAGASSKMKLMTRQVAVSKKVLIACLLSRLSRRCRKVSVDTL